MDRWPPRLKARSCMLCSPRLSGRRARRVEAGAVVGDRHDERRGAVKRDVDGARLTVAGRVRHRLAQDPQQGLPYLGRSLETGPDRDGDVDAGARADALRCVRDRPLERLVGRARQRQDRGAGLLERALGRLGEVLGAGMAGEPAALRRDVGELLREPVVELARQAPALVEHGVLGVARCAHSKSRMPPTISASQAATWTRLPPDSVSLEDPG